MIGEQAIHRASQWCYRGIWGAVTRWLRVPEEPPQLSGADDARIQYFRPSSGYLRYLKFYFWLGLLGVDALLSVLWLVVFIANPLIGILITPLALAVIVLPDVVAYVAIHLRYDSTWYVLSDRTMRIRRGIWQIHETTITFENIQNVAIRQGPVQRHYRIANVVVETAGGGSMDSHGKSGRSSGHVGLLEGVDNATEIRQLILERWKLAKSAGLGDEVHSRRELPHAVAIWPPSHIDMLEQIRDLAVRLAQPA
jgi:membrane protein YdbS with pleckstrin-like domain